MANLRYLHYGSVALFLTVAFYGCGRIGLFSKPGTQVERHTSVVGYLDGQQPEPGRVQELAEHNKRALALYATEADFYRKPTKDGRPRRCLALSGGGVRSALFSIGVMKALHEKQFLQQVDIISGVSGGAYAAAWYLVQQLDGGVAPTEDSEWNRHLDRVNANSS